MCIGGVAVEKYFHLVYSIIQRREKLFANQNIQQQKHHHQYQKQQKHQHQQQQKHQHQ